MTEGGEQQTKPMIEIAKAGASIDEMRKQASQERSVGLGESQVNKLGGEGITLKMLREAFGLGNPEEVKRIYRQREKEMRSLPYGVEVPKFLVGEEPDVVREKVREWEARARLSCACEYKKTKNTLDDISGNQEAIDLTNEHVEVLFGMKGVMEMVSLENRFIKNTQIRPKKDDDGEVVKDEHGKVIIERQNFDLQEWAKDFCEKDLWKKCPETIFKIKSRSSLEAFRQVKVKWLMTYRGLNREEAEDAEVVSRNLTYLSNELEGADTRYSSGKLFMPPDTKYATPTMPEVKNLNMWQLMHPQERLQAKVEVSNEAWSIFGSWALHMRNKSAYKDHGEIRYKWSVADVKIFPTKLIPDAFEFCDYTKTVIENGREKDVETTLAKELKINGTKLLEDPQAKDLSQPDFVNEVGEGVFTGYSFLRLSPAATILKVIAGGERFNKKWDTLGNALRNCHVPKEYRDKIVLGIYGVDPLRDELTPIAIGGSFNPWKKFSGFLKQIPKWAPDFWN